jgi:hypothetical protein
MRFSIAVRLSTRTVQQLIDLGYLKEIKNDSVEGISKLKSFLVTVHGF